MARRGQSPTQLVVDYFMNGDLLAVEQALVIGRSIIENRRAKETSVALSAPRKRVRTRKPAATPQPAAAVPAAQPVAPASAPVVRRARTRAAAAPADGAPRRRRGRPAGSTKTTGATPSLPSSGQPAAASEPAPLPDQGVGQGDE